MFRTATGDTLTVAVRHCRASLDEHRLMRCRTKSVLKSTRSDPIYDSNETMKKFEPHYRLVRVGMAPKIEKTSKQQQSEQQYWK
ncbi:hypothetical protein KCU78_g15413, partial [Aureobasidium melanogenum]